MLARLRPLGLLMACLTLVLVAAIFGRLNAAGSGEDEPISPIEITDSPTPTPTEQPPPSKQPQQIIPSPHHVGGDDDGDDDDDDGDDDGDDDDD